jgi:hypothetical protein
MNTIDARMLGRWWDTASDQERRQRLLEAINEAMYWRDIATRKSRVTLPPIHDDRIY